MSKRSIVKREGRSYCTSIAITFMDEAIYPISLLKRRYRQFFEDCMAFGQSNRAAHCTRLPFPKLPFAPPKEYMSLFAFIRSVTYDNLQEAKGSITNLRSIQLPFCSELLFLQSGLRFSFSYAHCIFSYILKPFSFHIRSEVSQRFVHLRRELHNIYIYTYVTLERVEVQSGYADARNKQRTNHGFPRSDDVIVDGVI